MNNYYKTLNIEGLGPKTKEDYICFNKYISSLNSKKTPKEKRCFVCNKKNIKYCNSHTIPQFILRNITQDGKLLNTQIFNSAKLLNKETGVNKTQVFHCICADCDNKIFKEYETKENYQVEPNQLMLKQIALKNHISRFCKHNEEKHTYSNILKEIKKGITYPITDINYRIKVTEHNYRYNNKRARLILKNLNNSTEFYKLCYYKKINYTVPYVLQANSILSLGFNNEKLANTFDFTSFDYADDIHFCIYPLEKESVIFTFCDKSLTIYDDFFETLKTKNEEEQLSILNFIAFAYFEDIFLNNKIDKSILENYFMKQITQEQMITYADTSLIQNLKKEEREFYKWNALSNFSIDNNKKIPNLLSYEYRIV